MRFGGLYAVQDVGFAAQDRQITAIIGPNGAGKTTLFNCLTGFYRPTAGSMLLHRGGRVIELAGKPAHVSAAHGLARTFQNIRLFAAMTALENLLVAEDCALSAASGLTIGALLGLPRYRRAEAAALERATAWLEKLGLREVANRPAGELPYGLQRRLEIARALCTRPALLCLDEPAAGLNPRESAELRDILRRIRDEEQIGILLIEHDMSVVMGLSDHIVVLDYGRKIAEGTPQDIRANPAVIRAYLGEPEEAA
jgi:branched-chain amino acid transport system ATP-binding protein